MKEKSGNGSRRSAQYRDPGTPGKEEMKSTQFRKELIETMPGYVWTVHRNRLPGYLSAIGIKTAGFNRLSTLEVTRREKDGKAQYDVRSSGFGKRSRWLYAYSDGTLARALRGLQNHYEAMASLYSNHAGALQSARKNQHNG